MHQQDKAKHAAVIHIRKRMQIHAETEFPVTALISKLGNIAMKRQMWTASAVAYYQHGELRHEVQYFKRNNWNRAGITSLYFAPYHMNRKA